MEDSFYVTLPSNSSLDAHPDNTLNHFFVALPSAFTLEGKWEVALVEFSYPHRWFNVVDGENRILCSAESAGEVHQHTVPEGFYPTPEDLLASITPPIEHGGLVRITYNKFIQKIVIKTDENVRIKLLDGLATLFGFNEKVNITGLKKDPLHVDLHPFHAMFVYTNIIEYGAVGHTRAPLLRTVNVEGKHGDVITKTYDSPHYSSLKQTLVDTIEIDIRDDTGRPIPFITGKVIVKLHFG